MSSNGYLLGTLLRKVMRFIAVYTSGVLDGAVQQWQGQGLHSYVGKSKLYKFVSLGNLCNSCLYEQPHIFCYFFILAFASYFSISPFIYFYLFLGSGKSLINQNFMQEEISSRLNLGDAYLHSA
jgi:hypothetical protein